MVNRLDVHGLCEPGFEGVRDALAVSLGRDDVGAAAAVFLDGEPVVDLWGGFADAERTRPWERDTIVNTWSVTKTVTNLCVLLLADRGALALDEPVAAYWPEFGAAGKERITVRQVLAHASGLPGWERPMAVEDLYDPRLCAAALAGQRPWSKPGGTPAYHSLTQGFLVGEVVRRVSGRGVGAFLAEEVAEPLCADFRIGVPPAADARIAPVIPPGRRPAGGPAAGGGAVRGSAAGAAGGFAGGAAGRSADAPDAARVLGNPAVRPSRANESAWRRAEIPAANGHGNARAVASILSVLACGGAARGVRLLSADGCAEAFRPVSEGVDRVLGLPLRFGAGFALDWPDAPPSGRPRSCYWSGSGGSVAVVDREARMAVCYVMNRMVRSGGDPTGDRRARAVVAAAYAGLGG